jgi:6,7-dimethyl-8-ribityllumazine synthase
MARIIEGKLNGSDLNVGLVVSRFNEFVTKPLLDGALNELRRFGVAEVNMTVAWVSGAFEIPVTLETMCQSKRYDALVALGCIIRGETSHYEHIAQSVTDQIQKISIQWKMPIGFGVLTVENTDQAIDRTGGKAGHRGRDAVQSVLDTVHVLRGLSDLGQKEKAIQDSFLLH